MKRLFILTCLILSGCGTAGEKLHEIIACGDDKVIIIDAKASDEESVTIVWEWKTSDAASQLPEEYQEYMNTIDDCKPVNNNTQLLLTASSGGVVLLDRATKNCLFYAHVPNAHSADLLPGGRIAVALSIHPAGNRIELYDIRKPEQVLFRDSLYSGHGAVWVAERNLFYALGYDELRAYSLKDWDTPAPKLALEKKWPIPVESGHDLSLVSGNGLLLSGHEGVYSFDMSTGKFTPFEPLQSTNDVKSVNYNDKTAELIYTKAEESWWTYHIYFKNPDKTLTIPNIKLYKVRTIKN
ncbi:MAG: DUF6528 family protein [Tannerella sp.]|nr:DUF6528 family protein [Tannerella sp.]